MIMRTKKRITSIGLSEKLIDTFQVISTIKGDKLSNIVEECLRDYIIKNKASANIIVDELFSEIQEITWKK